MQKIIGEFTSAVIYSDTAEDYAKSAGHEVQRNQRSYSITTEQGKR